MDKSELLQFLRENISLDTHEYRGYYGEHSISVDLKIDGETISSVDISMPKECDHRCDSY